MTHFAKVEDGVVTQIVAVSNEVITDESGDEQEHLGQEFLASLGFEGTWLQTSYNKNFRKNYAGIGFIYDSELDAFMDIQPFDSWILDEETCTWQPPTEYPDPNKPYRWDEATLSWELVSEE